MRMTRGAAVGSPHPECQKGEIFLTNVDSSSDDRYSAFAEIGWRSKRLGKAAYDRHGNRISGMRPVFVKRAELEDAGVISRPKKTLRARIRGRRQIWRAPA